MILNRIDFGPAFIASGGNNFNGEGWPYDKYYRFISGYTFKGLTHYTKTLTWTWRNDSKKGLGNMNIDPKTFRPKEKMPKSIKVDFLCPKMINAVGLSNLGLRNHVLNGNFKTQQTPYIFSIAALGNSKEERIMEAESQIDFLLFALDVGYLATPFALIRNVTCPNTGDKVDQLVLEAQELLKIDALLGVPHGIKLNLETNIEDAYRIVEDGYCDFIDIPNSLPLATMPQSVLHLIDVQHPIIDSLIRIKKSRQAQAIMNRYNGQVGYSGPLQFPLVDKWIQEYRVLDKITKIMAGSIYSVEHVESAYDIDANAVVVGAVKVLRPWRMRKIIERSHELFAGR